MKMENENAPVGRLLRELAAIQCRAKIEYENSECARLLRECSRVCDEILALCGDDDDLNGVNQEHNRMEAFGGEP